MDYIIGNEGIAGALIWQLQGHNIDGGFYWGDAGDIYNSEEEVVSLVRSYHWPGFDTGDGYYEATIVWMMREKAYEIRGIEPPLIEAPESPLILQYTDDPTSPPEFVWRGSAGASEYSLWRSEDGVDGGWDMVQSEFHDSMEANAALVVDEGVGSGTWYYCMKAHNQGGSSECSDVVGRIAIR